ncbi:hypothetical protein RJ640_028605, partial [Escallonia rubra]
MEQCTEGSFLVLNNSKGDGEEFISEVGTISRIRHVNLVSFDHIFIPKTTVFGPAKLCSKEKSDVRITMARETMGYIAPEAVSRNIKKLSCKSDVYSFVMLLLEMVGGYLPKMVGGSKNIGRTNGYTSDWIEEDGDANLVVSSRS